MCRRIAAAAANKYSRSPPTWLGGNNVNRSVDYPWASEMLWFIDLVRSSTWQLLFQEEKGGGRRINERELATLQDAIQVEAMEFPQSRECLPWTREYLRVLSRKDARGRGS